MENNELKADVVLTWNQEYRGIGIQVKFWGKPNKFTPHSINDGHGMWNYYIIIKELQCPEFFDDLFWFPLSSYSTPDRPCYNYCTDATNAMNLHGGITFYKRHNSRDYSNRAAEFGCDYGHSWDMNLVHYYTKETVWDDAKRSVDQLFDYLDCLNKTMLVLSFQDGKYYPADKIHTVMNLTKKGK